MCAVVGPTAAGKSRLSVALARRWAGEVVNADSMQIYAGMDIGTAKISAYERAGVVHHLLDIVDVTRPVTVAEFQGWARTEIEDCLRRGVPPVLVGGSALYVRAVLDRFEFPGTDPDLRAHYESELATHGPEVLHDRLAAVDEEAAAAILATNGRRIVRALEVVALTGRPYNAWLPVHEHYYDGVVMLGLDVPRKVLDARIEARVDAMWSAGLVAEVRELAEHGLADGRTASRALGYAQVLDFLAGRCTEDEARAETIRRTRRFARRQDSWFRKDPRVVWLPYDAPDLADRAAAAVGCGRERHG